VKKDFGGFQGLTPTGTPVPGETEGEKKDEKKGFAGFAAAAGGTGKEGGFAFGGKKDEGIVAGTEKKEEEKAKGSGLGGFGADKGLLPQDEIRLTFRNGKARGDKS